MPKNVIVAAVQLSYTRILFVEIMEYRIKKEEKFPSIINYNFQNHTTKKHECVISKNTRQSTWNKHGRESMTGVRRKG